MAASTSNLHYLSRHSLTKGTLMTGRAASAKHSYPIAGTGCTFVVTDPDSDRDLWTDYLAGAIRGYRKFGVEDALELDVIQSGYTTPLFFGALSQDGEMVAGVRVQGPYRSAAEVHAVREWEGHPGQVELRNMVAERIPDGVLEMKAAWVADHAPHKGELARAIARAPIVAMSFLGCRYALATAGTDPVIHQWESAGGVIAEQIPTAPYPSAVYHATPIWWDRVKFVESADPVQLVKVVREFVELTGTIVSSYVRAGAAL